MTRRKKKSTLRECKTHSLYLLPGESCQQCKSEKEIEKFKHDGTNAFSHRTGVLFQSIDNSQYNLSRYENEMSGHKG